MHANIHTLRETRERPGAGARPQPVAPATRRRGPGPPLSAETGRFDHLAPRRVSQGPGLCAPGIYQAARARGPARPGRVSTAAAGSDGAGPPGPAMGPIAGRAYGHGLAAA